MKIAILEVEDWERGAFSHLQNQHEVIFHEGPLTRANSGDFGDAEIISTFIYSNLDGAALGKFQSLKLIATRSTGFDHIDMAHCKDRGIKVANVPNYGENTVAEHVFALLGAISHNLMEAAARTRRGDFSQQGLQGFDLMGKTLGIIGTGHIGLYAARIAMGYSMKVVAFDVQPDHDLANEIGFRYVTMDELLATADIISIHVPGGPKTKHLIADGEFGKMKDGVVLINTARGEIVDVNALIRALAIGKVGAAGLDVLPEEPIVREEAELLRGWFGREHNLETLLADHVLLRLKNVIITPHSAFNTREAVQRILDTTNENIASFVRGQPVNIVSGEE